MPQKKYSYQNILNKDIIEMLLQMRNDRSNSNWTIGNLVVQITKAHQEAQDGYMLKDVAKAVAAMIGETTQAVLEMAKVRLAYSDEQMDQHQTLTWSYYQRASLFGVDRMSVLQWAEDQVDEVNRPASLDAVIVNMGNPNTHAPEVETVEAAKVSTRKKAVKAIKYLESRIKCGAIELDEATSKKVLGLSDYILKIIAPEGEKIK